MEMRSLKIYRKLESKKAIKFLAFGSSSTQRFDVGMHWFDYVELGFKNIYGGSCGQFINSGVTNNTTGDLIARFDEQLAVYQPDLVIMTVGANDCIQKVSIEEYRKNLLSLIRMIEKIGAQVVLQTYYACDLKKIQEHKANWNCHLATDLAAYMDVIREVAKSTNTCLINQDVRWSPLRDEHLEEYRTLMRDSLHLNARGNMLMGLEAMSFFGLLLRYDQIEYCTEGIMLQKKLEILSKKVLDFEGRVIK